MSSPRAANTASEYQPDSLLPFDLPSRSAGPIDALVQICDSAGTCRTNVTISAESCDENELRYVFARSASRCRSNARSSASLSSISRYCKTKQNARRRLYADSSVPRVDTRACR